jgi:hypothetical protein
MSSVFRKKFAVPKAYAHPPSGAIRQRAQPLSPAAFGTGALAAIEITRQKTLHVGMGFLFAMRMALI